MRSIGRCCVIAAFAVLLPLAARANAPALPVTIGTGAELSAWKATPADGVSLALGSEPAVSGGALRLDFDFHGGGGYAVAHRAVSLDLPANYEFTFRVRGECPVNNLEFKLIDASGDNVWWVNQRDVEFTPVARAMTLKKRHISFAWGPQGGGEPRHVAALEFAVTAGRGGRGRACKSSMRLAISSSATTS